MQTTIVKYRTSDTRFPMWTTRPPFKRATAVLVSETPYNQRIVGWVLNTLDGRIIAKPVSQLGSVTPDFLGAMCGHEESEQFHNRHL